MVEKNDNASDGSQNFPHLQWVQEHLGIETLSYSDISEGFVLLQILSLISVTATDLSWYSSSAAFECDNIDARIFADLANGLRQVGISEDDGVSEAVIAGIRNGDTESCNVLLSMLRNRYEKLHGSPAAASVSPKDDSDRLSMPKDYDSEWYEVAERSFKPAIRWTLLFAKCRKSEAPPRSSETIEEALTDLDRQNGKFVPRAKLIPYLCSGRLYEAVASQIFGEASPEYLDHLTTHGYLKFKSSLRDSIRDMIADDTPFYESIHCNLMEALIAASCRGVGVGNIVDHIRKRFPAFNIAALYPYDLEDALLIWTNQCLALIRKEAASALPASSRFAQTVMETPDVDELGPGFSDGRVFCLMMCLYLHNACERHMRHLLTSDARLANWTAFTSMCQDHNAIDVTWSPRELASEEHASPGSTGAVRLIYMSIVCQLFRAFQTGDGHDARAAIKTLALAQERLDAKAANAKSAIQPGDENVHTELKRGPRKKTDKREKGGVGNNEVPQIVSRAGSVNCTSVERHSDEVVQATSKKQQKPKKSLVNHDNELWQRLPLTESKDSHFADDNEPELIRETSSEKISLKNKSVTNRDEELSQSASHVETTTGDGSGGHNAKDVAQKKPEKKVSKKESTIRQNIPLPLKTSRETFKNGYSVGDPSTELIRATSQNELIKIRKDLVNDYDNEFPQKAPGAGSRDDESADTHGNDVSRGTEHRLVKESAIASGNESLQKASCAGSKNGGSSGNPGNATAQKKSKKNSVKKDPENNQSNEPSSKTSEADTRNGDSADHRGTEYVRAMSAKQRSKSIKEGNELFSPLSRTELPKPKFDSCQSDQVSEETSSAEPWKTTLAAHDGDSPSSERGNNRNDVCADLPKKGISTAETVNHGSAGFAEGTLRADVSKVVPAPRHQDEHSEDRRRTESREVEPAASQSSGHAKSTSSNDVLQTSECIHTASDNTISTQTWRQNAVAHQRVEFLNKTPNTVSRRGEGFSRKSPRAELEMIASSNDSTDADDAASDLGLDDMPTLFSQRANSIPDVPAMPMKSVFPAIVTSSLASSQKLLGVSSRDLTTTAHVESSAVRLPDITTDSSHISVLHRNSEISIQDRIWSAKKRSRPASAKSLQSTSVWVAAPPAQVNVNSTGTRVADPFSDEEGWSTEEEEEDPHVAQQAEEPDPVTDEAEWETDEEEKPQIAAKETMTLRSADKVVRGRSKPAPVRVVARRPNPRQSSASQLEYSNCRFMPLQTWENVAKETPQPVSTEVVTRRSDTHQSSACTPELSDSQILPASPTAETSSAPALEQQSMLSTSTTRPTSAVQIAPAAEPSRQRNGSRSAGSQARRLGTGLREYPLQEPQSEDSSDEGYAIRMPVKKSPNCMSTGLRQRPPDDADSADSSDDEDYAIRKPVEGAGDLHLHSDQKAAVVSSTRIVAPENKVTATVIAPAVTNASVPEAKEHKHVQKPAERLQEIKSRKAETIRRMEAAREQELQRIALQKQEDAQKKEEAKRIRLQEQSQKLEERAKQIADERAKLKKDQERAVTSPSSTNGAATSRRASKSSVRTSVKEQSNRQLIRNALVHVCLAGSVNEKCQEEVLEDLETTSSNHFIILFHAPSTQTFRGLYSYDPRLDQALKIHPGTQGPDVLDTSNVLTFYKYDSGARSFKPVPTKSFGRSVHAVAIGREWAAKGKEKAVAAKLHTKQPVKGAVAC
ncbi:Calmodulin-regulated spectrin-associated protein 1 [Geranomyces michiganensis]|nr:Calmodulin-regulated spectrin-associated protein 1 [Geranomyces michiganensis]